MARLSNQVLAVLSSAVLFAAVIGVLFLIYG